MPSAYLQPADYPGYGVPNATAPQVQQASALIDSFLNRQEGLIWVPDGAGNPCYMESLSPSITLTAPSAILPGLLVEVPVTGPIQGVVPGTVLILDAANAALTEAVTVNSITGNALLLSQVQFSHAAGALLGSDQTIVEQRYMPQQRPITAVAKTPVVRVVAGEGRYGYGRRGDGPGIEMQAYNLLAVMSAFGGPPPWEQVTAASIGVDPRTGQLWFPAGIMLAYYSEVRVHYIAGWQYANLPGPIKQACANIIQGQGNGAQFAGNIQALKAGDAAMTRFGPSVIDADTKALLNPYRAMVLG
jgi:hypothetical protein